jgi:hypothetical protein
MLWPAARCPDESVPGHRDEVEVGNVSLLYLAHTASAELEQQRTRRRDGATGSLPYFYQLGCPCRPEAGMRRPCTT